MAKDNNRKEEPMLSPPEFQIHQKVKVEIPAQVLEDIRKMLMPAIAPLLDRLATYARAWGMDLSFHASNGIVFALRTSDYLPGAKARTIDAIDILLQRFDGSTKEELKTAVERLRHEIINLA